MKKPDIHASVFIAAGGHVVGNVTIKENSSVWFNAVIRGDESPVTIGKYTNIQDGCVIHVGQKHPAAIGDYVVVGHGAIVHGCTIGNNCLIGMGATILDGARIGNNCIVGANALVTENQIIPDGSLVIGMPAKIRRTITMEEVKEIHEDALMYAKNVSNYQ